MNLLKRFFKKEYIHLIFLVIMNVQIYAFEGGNISIPKVAAMVLMSLLVIWNFQYCPKVIISCLVYYGVAFACVAANSIHLRESTVLYLGLFVISFAGYVLLLHKFNTPIPVFVKFLRCFLWAYIIVLIIQQFFATIGFRDQDITNICGYFDNKYKLNSLAIEPSHAGRIMGIMFLTFLKVDSIANKYANIKAFIKQNKKLFIGYSYAMITMGSSTALMVYLITMLYFIKKETVLYALPVVIAFYLLIPTIDWEPLNRGRAVVEAALTGKQDNIQEADGSASVRTAFYFNTIQSFDLTDKEFLFGHGIEEGQVYEVKEYNIESNLIGGIWQYGFIPYIFSLFIIYMFCCHFFSLENLIFFFFLGGGFGNVAYFWGAVLLLSSNIYYKKQYKNRKNK